ncbi:DHA2 family efflux MFS transporter permease subunit [Arthrobacter sp. ISL-30]|uniref:DHA2 family efflux MFS transporter permease subunit n=1 Tax=Arthrobacter sp. ISL-30 TaxID=2819109 RepID=UPI001BE649F0|nr:DHA2 family efflux MFS transporter permease subunit [Arthrobacter sp. ISL-30]MBT2513649.1 DHA2 family efflux MFS transporter permease subunit [Arthrobacter sp. ISL-30]
MFRTQEDSATDLIPWPAWRLALVIVFGAFMSGLDASVVAVGLDTLSREFDTDLSVVQWVGNGYLLALAVSLPACAWAGRRFGVGRLWLLALAGFTISSGLCAIAGSVEWLIAARVVQGLCAGLLIPAGQTILGQAVGPHRLGRVMASLGVAVTLAPALGPALGGILLHVASWPWLFLINLPLGAAGLALGGRYVPRDKAGTTERLDLTGLLLVSIGLPLVVLSLTLWAEHRTATAAIIGMLSLGIALLGTFALHGRRVAHPVLDLRLFDNRTYAAAATTTAFAGAVMFGAGVLFPLYYQLGRGQDPLATGLLLISLSAGTAVALPFSGKLADRYGGGIVAAGGAAATLVTTAPFVWLPLETPEILVQSFLVLRGMALALVVVPATVSAYRAVASEQLPDATTQVNILQRIGGALGGAVFTVVAATHLPTDAEAAFSAAFACLTAACAAALLGAVSMAVSEHRHSSTPT